MGCGQFDADALRAAGELVGDEALELAVPVQRESMEDDRPLTATTAADAGT